MGKLKLAALAHRLEGQPMFRLLEKVQAMEKAGTDIVHFEIGDPDFNTSSTVIESCVEYLRNHKTHYTSSYGIAELRGAIAQYTQKDLGFLPDLNQVVIAPGANILIGFILQCLVDQDEEVLVADPAFATYYSAMNYLGIKYRRIPLKESRGFRLDPQDVRRAITPRTKVLIVNSPHNPTGAVIPKEDMDAIYHLAEEHDFFIVSDEIYHLMVYDVKAPSASVWDQCRKRTVIINGFSKSFAMTGWRLGYAIAPEFLAEKLSLLMQTTISCVPSFIQWAGISVFDIPWSEVKGMMEEFQRRRDVLVEGLNRLPGVVCIKPQGAFYVFANVKATGMNGSEFAELMLREAGVALLPGSSFGANSQEFVRLSYATSLNQIREGLKRMRRVLINQRVLV